MAVRAGKIVRNPDGKFVATWEGLLEVGGTRDTGAALTLPGYEGGALAQAVGNFDTNATLTVQGSNDGTTWFALASALTAAAPSQIITAQPLFVRGAITADGAGDATDLDLIITGQGR